MKLSDFGLCKPLDCSAMSLFNEEALSNTDMDIDGVAQRAQSSPTQQEQLQRWKLNRRTLVIPSCHSMPLMNYRDLLFSFYSCLFSHVKLNLYVIFLKAYSTVGTPDYIAPEVLSKKGYGMECDW